MSSYDRALRETLVLMERVERKFPITHSLIGFGEPEEDENGRFLPSVLMWDSWLQSYASTRLFDWCFIDCPKVWERTILKFMKFIEVNEKNIFAGREKMPIEDHEVESWSWGCYGRCGQLKYFTKYITVIEYEMHAVIRTRTPIKGIGRRICFPKWFISRLNTLFRDIERQHIKKCVEMLHLPIAREIMKCLDVQ
jgi:hypothetical protein